MLTSLHTSMVPKTTCSPSKKLSPTMMTVDPPAVHPSLGLIALMHGVATGKGGYRPAQNKNTNVTLDHAVDTYWWQSPFILEVVSFGLDWSWLKFVALADEPERFIKHLQNCLQTRYNFLNEKTFPGARFKLFLIGIMFAVKTYMYLSIVNFFFFFFLLKDRG